MWRALFWISPETVGPGFARAAVRYTLGFASLPARFASSARPLGRMVRYPTCH